MRLKKAPFNSVKTLLTTINNFKSTETTSNNGGTVIYIKKSLNHKLRKHLEIYNSKQLESTFTEVNLNNKNKKLVLDCVHRHLSMELWEFKSDSNLLYTLTSENMHGDFNADILKYDQNSNSSDFLVLMYSSFYFHTFSTQIVLYQHLDLS